MNSGKKNALAIVAPAALFLLVLAVFLLRGGKNQPSPDPVEKPDPVAENPAGSEDPLPDGDVGTGEPVAEPGNGGAAVEPKGRVLPLQLTDREGRPLRGRLRLMVSTDYFKTHEVVELETDEEGGVEADIDPKAWVALDASAQGHAGRWMPPVTWGKLDEEGLSFSLGEGQELKGRISFVDDNPGAELRVRFSPVFPPGSFPNQLATRLDIEDEVVTTDETGAFSCSSLRKGGYEISFPDHPEWPKMRLKGEQLESGELDLPLKWRK